MNSTSPSSLFFRLLTIFILFNFSSIKLHAAANKSIQVFDSTISGPYQIIQNGYDLSRQNQAKAKIYFEEAARYFMEKKDSAWYVKAKLGIADLYKGNGQYFRSFDEIWNLVDIAEKTQDKSSLIELERKLGVLYGLYGKDSLSLFHLKRALHLAQDCQEKKRWSSSYLAIAKQYIDMNKPDKALAYLDSCYIVNASDKRLIYIDAFYGYIYTQKGQLQKAEQYLKNLIPIFQENGLAFLAKVYMFYGDLAKAKDEKSKAINYYKAAIAAVDRMVVHTEIKPYVLESLAELNYQLGHKNEAYHYMKLTKEISTELFHTQSENNKTLIEIKSEYQEELKQKELELSNQRELLSLKEKASKRLKFLIIILFILAIFATLAIKQQSKVNNMLETRKKNESIIELRNKELTSNALQIIKKDQTVDELLELIKKEIPGKYRSINHKFKQNNEKIWNDFHLRFTQTNDAFYNKLLEKHPSLTPNDLRYCALIKLNFNNSEVAHILNVSLHSVHMARYRIRKKLNIPKEESLSNYITRI